MALINIANKIIEKLNSLPGADFPLAARLAVAFPFWSSGRSKAGEGLLDMGSFTVSLFEDEYNVPLLDPELAAQLALYAETFLPIMLVIGLGGRIASAGLLFMILVITISYPQHNWMESVSWGVALLAILLRGSGKLSIDHLIAKKFAKS